MKAYIILILKWAITLTISYAIYREGSTYAAIGLMWVMVWVEVLGGLIGQALGICHIHGNAIKMMGEAQISIIDNQSVFAAEIGDLFKKLLDTITIPCEGNDEHE